MLRKNIVGLLICIAAIGATTLGFAGIPDLDLSSCAMLNATPGATLSVYNVPDGSGYSTLEARRYVGPAGTSAQDDATITVTLLDSGSNPVFAYPFEDMWIECPPLPADLTSPGLLACPNGTTADASTDINGQTTFSGPFFAGGYGTYSNNGVADDGVTYVMISGLPLTNGAMPLVFNSSDINGDGVWDTITDVLLFSQRYPVSGGYHYSVDYYFDELNAIGDLVLFSAARNVTCP
jgi:hypothetical protein